MAGEGGPLDVRKHLVRMKRAGANASSGRRKSGGHPLERRDGVLKAIAAFKLVKALLLIGVGLGALKLLNAETAEKAERWVSVVAWRLGPQAAFAVQNKLARLQDSQLRVIGVVAFLYAGLFAVEGVGLWKSKRWAEYLTIIATSSFVPFEVYELIQQVSWQRVTTLGINLLVVGYLVWKVKRSAA